MGAPDGFIDVVAAVKPIADGDTDTPAHWTVTFGVDDIEHDREAGHRARRHRGRRTARRAVDEDGHVAGPAGCRVHRAVQFVVENAELNA